MNKIKKNKNIFFWIGNIILLGLVFLLVLFLLFEKKYQNKIYPNIFVAGVDLSGLSLSEAESLLLKEIDSFQDRGFLIRLNEKSLSWHNFIYSPETEAVIPTVDFDVKGAIEQAYLFARQGQMSDVLIKLKSFFQVKEIDLPFYLNEEDLFLNIKQNFSDLEKWSQESDPDLQRYRFC